jgi:DNA polymerase II small subunit
MQTLETKKKTIVDFFLKKGLLVNNDLLKILESEENLKKLYTTTLEKDTTDVAVLNQQILDLIKLKPEGMDWAEIDRLGATTERKSLNGKNSVSGGAIGTHHFIKEQSANTEPNKSNVRILFSYDQAAKKREAGDFTLFFNSRFRALEKILRQRQELQNAISISRIFFKKNREQISVVGLVWDKQQTKNGNIMVTLEDPTGYIKVLVNKNKPDLLRMAKEITLDEALGVSGVNGDKIIFANNLFSPEVPIAPEMKKSEQEGYALFLSDIHIGSKYFLEDDFNKFIKWINQELGNDSQKKVASKVKYIFIIGDIVDGCGIYPNQEKELKIKDIKDQYREAAKLLSKIRQDIEIVICPGNHDAIRLAEPQPPIYRDFAEELYAMPNVKMVSNPAIINIHSSDNFTGYDVLLYHGYSFDYYFAQIEHIRNQGGYDRVDLLLKFLLQKRHMAPTYTSTPYIPDLESDFLVIDKIPDFFVSGHIHKAAASNYRGITVISGSCWQSKTAYQEKVGHNPEPSRVPLVDLETRKIRMLKFGKD